MANENTTNNETMENQTVENKPTVEELMAQLEQLTSENAQLASDRDKYKGANDKLSKESADYKRQLRAKQTEEEREAEAKAEADRVQKEELENLKKELNHNKAVNAYKAITDDSMIETLIDAVSDADHNAIAKIIADECKKAVTEAETTWLKERPRVQHGQYSSMTAEQIMAIPDRQERASAIAMNQELFK
jgi:chromosome segregation ATPase